MHEVKQCVDIAYVTDVFKYDSYSKIKKKYICFHTP